MPQDITTAQELLAEILAQAQELGLHGSGNPDSLSSPVDEVDAWIDHKDPDDGVPGVPQHDSPIEYIEHSYTETDDQPFEDPEEMEMAMDTLNIFVKDLGNNPRDKNFENEFRAFLHCDDYSYSAKTIQHLISSALGLD